MGLTSGEQTLEDQLRDRVRRLLGWGGGHLGQLRPAELTSEAGKDVRFGDLLVPLNARVHVIN